jgi:HlyD family secretion protein
MASGDIGAVLKDVEILFHVGTVAGLSDLQLMERFVSRSDDGAEAAFAALVKRHGPMVLRVCRGELQDLHAAEDAFQATFLILARKARSIRKAGSLASWLYGVARRVARRARADRARRAACQRRGTLMAESPVFMGYDPPELVPEIQEEVDRLPEKYRAPIILCYLEGLTHEEAASQLRVPVGTVKIRLSRGRERLRGRLIRRGLAPALIASALSASTRGAIPIPLLDITVKAAMQVAAVQAAGVSVAVTALVEGVLKAMFLAKLRTIAALIAASMTLALTSLFLVAALSPTVRSDQGTTPPNLQEIAKERQKSIPPPIPEKPAGDPVFIVKKGDFRQSTTQLGTVQATQSVELYPKISGELMILKVDIGDPVKQGQVVAEIDAPDARADLEKAEAVLKQAEAHMRRLESSVRVAEAALRTEGARTHAAQAELKQSMETVNYREKQFKRIEDLHARAAVNQGMVDEEEQKLKASRSAVIAVKYQLELTQAGFESAEAKLGTAKADVEEARAEYRVVVADRHKAELHLSLTRVQSPIDGVVTRRGYHVGEFARAAATGGSAPLFTIIQTGKVRIIVYVPDRDASYLDKGDPATFRAEAQGGRQYQGTISRAAVAEEPSSRTLRAEIDLDNADGRLRPGQLGQVTVALDVHPNAIMIPMKAILGSGFETLGPVSCYRVVAGRPVRTPIKLGALDRDSETAEVLDGVKEGDTIVPDWRQFNDPERQYPAAGDRP